MSNEIENSAAPEEERANTPEAQAAEPAVPAISPGKTLAQRREELNLTVEQVAGQLNLAPRQVEAIEADNFAALPGMAIARGFVRSYAKLVRIDAEPLLAAMAPAVAPMPQARQINQTYVAKSPTGDRLSFGERSTKASKTLWIVMGVIAAGVAIAAAMQFGTGRDTANDGETAAPEAAATSEPTEGQDGRTVEVLPAPELPAESAPVPDAAPSSSLPASPASPSGVQAAPSANAQPMAAGTSMVPAKPEPDATASAVDEKNVLVLRMREQSWVEIKRNDGAVIASRIFDAGAVEAVPLKGEMLVVVGNASGVDASLRGEALDLQAKARANVARINVK